MFHKDFPLGKGLWVWRLEQCLHGNIDAIIQKCHNFDISYLLIKSGDGANIWAQFTSDLVGRLHSAGIKVYSWSYVYGSDPLKEAQVAIHSLDIGADGHVFDAEGEYERLANNAQAAETMLKAVRAKYPDKFLAHAPFPVIDYHTSFPYITFGKYCDAVMPQIYYGTMKLTPQEAILRMYDNFVRWQKNWTDSGHADSIKPIIPLGQTYDNMNITPPYILTPSDITSFVSIVKGYKSVNFWSFQHILREDCWAAIRDAKVDAPSNAERGIVPQESPTAPAQAPVEAPAESITTTPSSETYTTSTGTDTIVDTNAPAEEPTAPEVVASDIPVVSEVVPLPESTPTATPNNPLLQVDLPKGKSTTIVMTPNNEHPDGVEITVYAHKTHREYFIDALKFIWSLLQSKIF